MGLFMLSLRHRVPDREVSVTHLTAPPCAGRGRAAPGVQDWTQQSAVSWCLPGCGRGSRDPWEGGGHLLSVVFPCPGCLWVGRWPMPCVPTVFSYGKH